MTLKTACSLSYMEYRPNTNAAISCNTGHTKRRSCMGGVGKKKGTKNLSMVDILSKKE
jgi:hypothetical protein